MLGVLCLGLWMLTAPPVRSAGVPTVQHNQWMDLNGIAVNPFLKGGRRATVLLFIMTDCPIANGYAPEVNRTVAEYSRKRFGFYIVYVDQNVPTATIRKHVKDYGYHCSALLDPNHSLARRAGATVTPEAVVFNTEQEIAYRGRIDDRVVDFGKIRQHPNRKDLRITLDAILAGKAVPMARTPCVGCYITSDSTKQ